MASKTVASEVPFSDLCRMFDSMAVKKPVDRKRQLHDFITEWRRTHKRIHGENQTSDSFYPALRLILPSFDKERGAYGFKENMLAKRLINLFGMKDGPDAHRLLNFRAPNLKSTEIGDFAASASKILRLRLPPEPETKEEKLKIDQLNEYLTAIEMANANKDKKLVEENLEMLCRKVTETEMKWLIRILLKQMKIGMQEKTVLNEFHPEADQLYDVCTSLKKVAEHLHDPATRLDVIQVQLFNPFRPMLANRAPIEKVTQIMNNDPFYVEIKYDGERVQLHKDGDKYRYFSRNGNDFTSSYGGSATEGSLTKHIHGLFAPHVQSCIIDAEMVGWNPAAKCIATKGDQFDVKSLKEGDDLHPCLISFDCLMLNGQVYTQHPLSHRIGVLESVFASTDEGRCMLADRLLIQSSEELVSRFNLAIENREEGIVVKRPCSTYRLNLRSNEGGWLKLKPDYIDAVNDDFDFLIVGGYFGEGKRANLISHFLLAAALPTNDPAVDPSKFLTVCKVGSGYSLKELYDLNVHLNQTPLLIRPKDRKPPDWLQVGTERPDVYIDPKNSKVVQVRAAEITASNAYAVGHTLRFPRVQKIRTDKDWKSCTTTAEFDQIREECMGKLAKRVQLTVEDGAGPAKKRRVAVVVSKPTVGAQFRAADVRGVKRKSQALRGKELCVMCGSDQHDKHSMETAAVELGASIVQHPGTNTFAVVAARQIIQVKNIIHAKTTNVVRLDWLLKCIEQQRLVPWQPSDMWYAKPEVEQSFKSNFDQFGDSYTEPVTGEQLKLLLDNVTKPEELTAMELSEMMSETIPEYSYGLFRPCRLYLDRFLVLNSPKTAITHSFLEMSGLDASLHGAELTQNIDQCTHVVMHSSDLSRLTQLHQLNRQRTHKFHLVTEDWVTASIGSGKLLNESNYQPI